MDTARDRALYSLLQLFKCMNTEQIRKLVYDNADIRYVRKRLQLLCERNLIYRNENKRYINQQYVYHLTKSTPKQASHRLKLVDTFIALISIPNAKINDFRVEYEAGKGVRSDGYIEIDLNGKERHLIFLEVHNWNKFNFNKYIELYKSGEYKKYQTFPKVAIITDDKLDIPKDCEVEFIKINGDLSNIMEVFRQ